MNYISTLLWIIVVIVIDNVIVTLFKFLFYLFFVILIGTDNYVDLLHLREILLPINGLIIFC
jgi:hypothetical protein